MPRWNSGTPSRSSRLRTSWPTAAGVTFNSSAAAEKLWWRALASKARSAFRKIGVVVARKIFFQWQTEYLICEYGAGRARIVLQISNIYTCNVAFVPTFVLFRSSSSIIVFLPRLPSSRRFRYRQRSGHPPG
jgi:hypothetical protein